MLQDPVTGSPLPSDGSSYDFYPYWNVPPGYGWYPAGNGNGGSGYPVASSNGGGGGLSRAAIFTPVVIATAALIGSAVLIITYYRFFAQYCIAWQIRWGIRRRVGGGGSGGDGGGGGEQFLLSGATVGGGGGRGLDEAVVRKIPVYHFKTGEGVVGNCHECAVCLGEFEDDDQLRLLPKCGHAFHLACIDVWLASHSNCPLCRAPVVAPAAQIMYIVEGDRQDQAPAPAAAAEDQPQDQQEHEAQIVRQLDQEEQRNPVESEMVITIPFEPVAFAQTAAAAAAAATDQVRQLRRSSSLQQDHLRSSNRFKESFLRRCRSLQLGYTSGFESGELLLTNNAQPEQQGFVVVNIEVGSSSSSSSSSSSASSSNDETKVDELPSIRKSTSLKESLGRVFSLRGFGRSKSAMHS